MRALCGNRDLPRQLPFGAGQPRMRLADPEAPAAPEAECLSPPTHTLRPELGSKGAWRLVSHLALNHLAVTGGRDAALALQEFLRLNDHRGTPESRAAIAALAAVEARPGLARIPGQRPGVFARGLDVTLVFDPEAWAAGGLYGLAAAIERFLRLQVSVNGFVRTRVRLAGRDAPVAGFPPRSGTRALL